MIDANVITAFRQATVSDKELKKLAMSRALLASPEFVELSKEAGLADWIARQAIKRGGGSSSKWGQKRLLRSAASKGREGNVAQRIAATEAGKSPAYVRRTSRAEGRKPVMDMKREIAGLQRGAAERFAGPTTMESLRRVLPGTGTGKLMERLSPLARTGPGGPGLGKRDMIGRYLQGAPMGRRGMVAGGLDAAVGLGRGLGRMRKGIGSGLRGAPARALQGARRPELGGARMYTGNPEAQLMRTGMSGGAGAAGGYALG